MKRALVRAALAALIVSVAAPALPEAMAQARLYPVLPPEGMSAWCFYPMSKRRNPDQNWFTLPYDERKDLMYEHGASGRAFAGRVFGVNGFLLAMWVVHIPVILERVGTGYATLGSLLLLLAAGDSRAGAVAFVGRALSPKRPDAE